MRKFSNRFETEKVPGLSFVGSKSRTHQSFAKDADINNVMKKYAKTGFLVDPSLAPSRRPQFGDFTGVDFLAHQNKLVQVRNWFAGLPSAVRAEFSNRPETLLDYIEAAKTDEKKRERLYELEIVERPKVQKNPDPAGLVTKPKIETNQPAPQPAAPAAPQQ